MRRSGRVRWDVKQPHLVSGLGWRPGQETNFTISWFDDAESQAI